MMVWNTEVHALETMTSKSKQRGVNAVKKITATSAFKEAISRNTATDSPSSTAAVSSPTENA